MLSSSTLSTKLFRPRLAQGLVERSRLLDTLNEHLLQRRLTIVSAPPGYGKTTLIAHWVSTLDIAAAWVSVDELNNNLDSITEYLTAAIEAVFPNSCPLASALLASPQQILPSAMADALIEDLANLPESLVIVLDDFHVIDAPAVHDCLQRVVQYMPTNCHIVITTRKTPPWTLGRLRMSDELAEIDVDDLRFTTSETRQYLYKMLKTSLDDDALESLEHHTEGWVAGLQMVALGLRKTGNQIDPESSIWRAQSLTTEYLVDEVLDRQTPVVRDFLLRTSILDRICDPLARAILGSPENGAELEPGSDLPTMGRLMRANLFLSPLDNRHVWYRYHHLFQELLRQRLAEMVPADEIRAMHRRAGEWFEAQGSIDNAIRHAVDGGDDELAVRIVTAHLQETLNSENWRPIARWLDLLPEPARRHPAMLVARGWSLHSLSRYYAMATVVAEAESKLLSTSERFSATERRLLQAQIDTLSAVAASWTGDAATTIERAERALRHLEPGMLLARGLCEYARAVGHHAAGRLTTGLTYLQLALDNQTERSDAYSVRLFLAQCTIYLERGHLPQFKRAAEVLGRISERAGLAVATGWHHFCMGVVAYEWNDLSQAVEYLGRVTQSPYEVNGRAAYDSFVGLALAQEGLGQTAAADETVQRLNQFLIEQDYQAALGLVETIQLRLMMSRNESPELPSPAVPLTVAAAGADLQYSYWVSSLTTQAQALIYRKIDHRREEVRDILAASRLAAESINQLRLLAKILALEALHFKDCCQEEAALAALRRSVELAEPGRLIRTYVDCGPQLIPLFERLRDELPASHYVERVLGAFASSAAAAAQAAPVATSVEPYLRLRAALTNREMEVLVLLADRKSNKEIASHMVVAPETVKRYTSRIFQKLGVNNRRAAVGLAEHLGLIPS